MTDKKQPSYDVIGFITTYFAPHARSELWEHLKSSNIRNLKELATIISKYDGAKSELESTTYGICMEFPGVWF
jgi:hypothetical protein